MRINTLEKLQDILARTLSWRKKELIDMIMLIQETNNPTLIRAGIALLSAHFEGYLKEAANYYIIFVSDQHIKNSQLKNSFLALQCKNKFFSSGQTKKTSTHTKFLNELLDLTTQNFSIRFSTNNPIISTESNPTSAVFEEILQTLSLDFSPYETKRNYIDADLLKNRNSIVHGEKCYVQAEDYMSTLSQILGIMENLNQQIFDAAHDKQYLNQLNC